MAFVNSVAEDLGPSPKTISRSWLAPLVALTLAASSIAILEQMGAHRNYQASTGFILGFLGGWIWQSMNPRDFVDRFQGWVVLLPVAALFLLVPGVEVGPGAIGASAWLGIPVGVVWRESDRRRRGASRAE
jgi:hypothetical protein